jgi:hypothetical protein
MKGKNNCHWREIIIDVRHESNSHKDELPDKDVQGLDMQQLQRTVHNLPCVESQPHSSALPMPGHFYDMPETA